MLKNAVEARRLRLENRSSARQFGVGSVLTGESIPVKALRQQIRLMAPSNGRVLIYGESGTGKELIACPFIAESLRRDRVFVELNCAAYLEAHIEAELFGYRHGAVGQGFSPGSQGGPAEHRGTLERADGGSLFLDEVGDMSLKTQAKVLSALDDQLFTPVGGTQPLRVDVRLIASTNKDLEEEIAKGNFREDLFYRLNVVPSLCRPSASASRIFPCSQAIFSPTSDASTAARAWRLARKRSKLSPSIIGPAMCARAQKCHRARAHFSIPASSASNASICRR